MSTRNKLQKFADLRTFPNVYENPNASEPSLIGLEGAPVSMKGHWCAQHFGNNKPLTLELACGRGEYSLALGRLFPDRNFIGVDIKGARIHQGARVALEEKLNNVAFLRTRIEQIALFFEPQEVSEIWITFPDPFLRESKANRRLTSPPFLDRYRQILKKGGLIHLKTDSTELYDFTLETLATTPQVTLLHHDDDIYSKPLFMEELSVKTYYERMHLAKEKTIKYIRFNLEG